MAAGIGIDSDTIVRSPRQASTIYSLDAASAPRHRNLFVVSFSKAGDPSAGSAGQGTSSSNWLKSMTFLAKSVDRPNVEPKVEEVKQYNKTRLITTGVKYGPSRLTLYDTADSMAMRMMAEYSKYYFGDFRHGSSITDWNSDVVQDQFNDSGGGFGFAPQAAANGVDDFNAQFFFDSMSVYQVYGGNFVQYKLLKPKITSFAPDELDYQNSEVPTITMTIAFEAMIFVNDFAPQPLTSDSFLTELFNQGGAFNGDVMSYPGTGTTDPSVSPTTVGLPVVQDILARTPTDPVLLAQAAQRPIETPQLRAYDTGVSSGGLNAYGLYNFGTTATPHGSVQRSLASDLSLLSVSNPSLATALSIAASTRAPILQGNPNTLSQGPISQAAYDAASAAIQAAGLQGGAIDGGALAEAMTFGAISSAYVAGTTPREMVYSNSLPPPLPVPYAPSNGNVTHVGGLNPSAAPFSVEGQDGTVYSVAPVVGGPPVNSWNSASGQGLALSPVAYGVVNAQRPATAQIGFNEQTTVPYTNRFGQRGTFPPTYK